MATTGMWAVKSRLDHLVNYVSNPLKTVTQYVVNDEKTLEKRYVSYLNCSFENPRENMENTKKHYHDESQILAFHGYQSFEEDEIEKIQDMDGKVVSLGPRILRTETASVVASSIVLYELSDLGGNI